MIWPTLSTLRLPGIAVATGVAFAGLAAQMAASTPDFTAQVEERFRDIPAVAPAHPAALPAGQAVAELTARPLFSRTRRPPPPVQPPPRPPPVVTAPATPPPPPPPPPLSELRLIGTIVGPSDRSAILRSQTAVDTLVVRQGEKIEGWVLEEVSIDSIVLRFGKAQKQIRFPQEQAGFGAAPPGAPKQAARSRNPVQR